uniref:5'-deoxynucleotidase HDDC2 n=1 Tax=Caligus clemensi TaxID=344056 RepID=C1C317_CALCM|nr:HD domain-containing protein 2 [Caligus clemensi]
MSFGESAWRMALLCMCLPPTLNRERLVKISLTSAFTCFGSKTDQNSQWTAKLKEVKSELFRLLPFNKAVELFDMYSFHVAARMGQNSSSRLGAGYRGILEVEEALLQTEELAKEEEITSEEVIKIIINRMAKAKFVGYEKYEKFNDDCEFRSIIKFIQKASILTKLKRTGWVRYGVSNPETVAGHMFRMGVMSLIFSDSPYKGDNLRDGSSVTVSLVHDIAECIVGDITPVDGISDDDKHAREMKAIKELTEPLRGDLGCDIYTNFERYEFQKDPEARLTKEIDKLDMIIQAHEYETIKGEKFLQEFFDSTVGKGKFTLDVTKDHVKALMTARNAQ